MHDITFKLTRKNNKKLIVSVKKIPSHRQLYYKKNCKQFKNNDNARICPDKKNHNN